MTETEKLFIGLKQHDERTYVQLFNENFRYLHRFAVSFLADYDIANDIVQSVFISIYENASSLKPDLNLKSYLIVSVRNRCLNYLRDQAIEDRQKILYLQASEEADCIPLIEDEELIDTIKIAISKLPDKCKNICELRFYENLKFTEIARKLSISENTAKVQVHRGIQKIKQFLSENHSSFLFIIFLLIIKKLFSL